MTKYDMAVFIGRFQPLTNGHTEVIKTALIRADKVVILVGSTNSPRNYYNPWSFEERRQMILGAFPDDANRIIVKPVEDSLYNNEKWVKNIQQAVLEAFVEAKGAWHPLAKVTLIGHSKDNSSFYLKLFPQWDNIEVPNYCNLSATDVRNWYFADQALYFTETSDSIPSVTRDFLREFFATPDYQQIRDEYEFVAKYKKSWESAPYPPIFVTTDAVVVQSGHILLVQRGHFPGKGLWALPGGFLNPNELVVDGVIRELKEETRIKVPVPVLKGSIVAQRVFDDVHRSSRGRTITHGFLFHLNADHELPKVKGSDDAAYATWIPLSQVTRSMMFEDHKDIIDNLTALL